MARKQETFGKKEREKKRLKKREDKKKRKEERKANAKGGGFENMIAYVDEFGQLTDTPPDPTKRVKIDASTIEIGTPKMEDREETVDPIRKGKVAFFDTSKGFGFIQEQDSQEKYFVHISNIIDEIKENDKVSFELERGQRGMNAVRVKKI